MNIVLEPALGSVATGRTGSGWGDSVSRAAPVNLNRNPTITLDSGILNLEVDGT